VLRCTLTGARRAVGFDRRLEPETLVQTIP
jgi:hypothetical protein